MPTFEIVRFSRFVQFNRRAALSAFVAFLWAATICGALGCSMHKKANLPVVLSENPSVDDLQTVVNKNAEKIRSIYSSNATVGAKSSPGWAVCRLAFEKPGKFRLIGSATLTGRVVDCGCNDERFWFWSGFQNSDELYFCRLDQYRGSALDRVLPLDPTWFPEAFGVVELKDGEIVDGPTEQSDGSLLVTTKKKRPDGDYLRRIYFEPKTAAILRQDVQNPNGDAIVSVRCEESQYIESVGVVLPKKLEIYSPATNETLIVDLGTPSVNDSDKITKNAFEQPTDLKATAIDLGATKDSSADDSSNANSDATNSTPAADASVKAELPPPVLGTGLPIDASGRGTPLEVPATTFGVASVDGFGATNDVPFPSGAEVAGEAVAPVVSAPLRTLQPSTTNSGTFVAPASIPTPAPTFTVAENAANAEESADVFADSSARLIGETRGSDSAATAPPRVVEAPPAEQSPFPFVAEYPCESKNRR